VALHAGTLVAEESTVKDGLYIGLAQVLALAPGTSRSGITITAARYLGLDAAARFSFLLLIPIVATGLRPATFRTACGKSKRPGAGGPFATREESREARYCRRVGKRG